MKSAYQEAYDKWVVDQTPDNMSGVLDALMPTINSEILRYEGPKSHLRSKAKALAVKAVQTYNPMSGTKLQSWVVTNLKPLARYGQGLRDVKAPEVAVRQAAELNRVTKDLADSLGRDPTDDELADEVGISKKRIGQVRKMVVNTITTGSVDAINEQTEGGAGAGIGVTTVSKVPYAQEAVYMSLNPRDQFIFDSRTGLHGKRQLSNADIAKRLGVSPAAVTQRSNAIASMITEMSGR